MGVLGLLGKLSETGIHTVRFAHMTVIIQIDTFADNKCFFGTRNIYKMDIFLSKPWVRAPSRGKVSVSALALFTCSINTRLG